MAIDRYTIKLKSYLDVFIEKLAGETLYPGMLLGLNSSDQFVAHNDDAPAAACVPIFAIEDALQGKGVDDAYVSGDWVRGWVASRGDVVYALLEDGANVVIGDFLESNGSGYLQKFTSGNGAVAIALEALNLSGPDSSDAPDPNNPVSPFGYNRRIKVMVI